MKIKRPGRQRVRGRRRSSARTRSRRSTPSSRPPASKPAKGTQAHAGDRQHAAAGHHQGGACSRQLHLGRQLPGDDQGADRGGPGRQGRLPGRPEGERDPGPPDPGRHRLPQHHEAEVRIRPEALEALAAEKGRVLERAFPLLQTASRAGERGGNGDGAPSPPPPQPPPAPSSSTHCCGSEPSASRRRVSVKRCRRNHLGGSAIAEPAFFVCRVRFPLLTTLAARRYN